jgi:hypothetical protein
MLASVPVRIWGDTQGCDCIGGSLIGREVERTIDGEAKIEGGDNASRL